MGETVLTERDDSIVVLRMNRPDKHHALNAQLAGELLASLRAIRDDDDVRVVILTGTGTKAFCAGQDMSEATEGIGRAEGANAGQLFAELGRFPRPVIAAVNGYCYGAGAVLATLCDIRLVAESATFRFPGAAYGLVVGAARLPAIVGAAKAKELIFTAKVVGAAEAGDIGLANHVVSDDRLMDEALAMARTIAANSAEAVTLSKAVVDTATLSGPAEQGEAAANKKLRASAEHRERFKAAADSVTRRG